MRTEKSFFIHGKQTIDVIGMPFGDPISIKKKSEKVWDA